MENVEKCKEMATPLDVSETNVLFRKAANYAFMTYVILIIGTYSLTPYEELVYLSNVERTAAFMAFCCLSTATLLLLSPFLIQRRVRNMGPVIYAALVVQGVAMCTNLIMAFCPVVVRVDAITLSRVYITRWCEWIPLSGLMTFLSEGILIQRNSPRSESSLRAAITVALAQVLSCVSGGLVVVYCPEKISWGINMFISFVTYFFMFPRVFIKRRMYQSFPDGNSFIHRERTDRLAFSYHLILTCTIVWTILVVFYCVNATFHRFFPDHPWHAWRPAMIFDTSFDVIAKAFYTKCIMDVHFAVFDIEARAMRQLLELRTLMSVIWDSSSDVIIVSLKDGDNLISILSPSFFRLVGSEMPASVKGRRGTALMMEMKPKYTPNPQESGDQFEVTRARYIDSKTPSYRGWLNQQNTLEEVSPDSFHVVTASFFVKAASLLSKSPPQDGLRPHSFSTANGEARKSEIKVSQHEPDVFISVVRDVTERYRWFEAERRAHAEVLKSKLMVVSSGLKTIFFGLNDVFF
jgi:hypothetical protein